MFKRNEFWLLVLFLICVFYFPLFYRLDALVIREWDEARNAVNATEMIENKNLLIRHFDGYPDMYEVKPPFLTWVQAAGIKLLGYNELPIRLPSVMATLMILFSFIFFFGKEFNNLIPGVISSLVLVTSPGYIGWHVTRTGDHDAVVIMFMFIALLAYFKFLQTEDVKERKIMFWIACISLILGFLTKSITSLMLLPGMFLYTLYSGNLKRVFSSKMFYIGIFTFLLVIGSYYFTREYYNTGYLKAIWTGELLPRYINAEENFHNEPYLYYIQNMISWRFVPWIYVCAVAILFQWFVIPEKNRQFTIYVSLTLIVYLFIISNGSNNVWYDAPAYPLMAVITGQFFYYLLVKVTDLFKLNPFLNTVLMILVILVSFYNPYRKIIKSVSINEEHEHGYPYYSISYMLRDYQNGKIELPLPLNIVYENYNGHFKFYLNAIKETKNIDKIKFSGKEDIVPGDYIIVSEQKVHDYIKMKFSTEIINHYKSATIYYITGIEKLN